MYYSFHSTIQILFQIPMLMFSLVVTVDPILITWGNLYKLHNVSENICLCGVIEQHNQSQKP
jgi:hypothetical protein